MQPQLALDKNNLTLDKEGDGCVGGGGGGGGISRVEVAVVSDGGRAILSYRVEFPLERRPGVDSETEKEGARQVGV